MSKYSLNDIKLLISKSNENNKSIILKIINEINEEDKNINIEFEKINNINKIFFKKDKTQNTKNKFCTICQNSIKSKEHKIKLSKCDHIFHKKCLNKYLKICLLDFKCPNCNCCYNNELTNIIKKKKNNQKTINL